MSFENWDRFLADTIADLQADKKAEQGSRRTVSKNTHASQSGKHRAHNRSIRHEQATRQGGQLHQGKGDTAAG